MTKRERFLIFCMEFIRVPYIWGGADPKIGLDCSGLVQHLLGFLDLDPYGDQTAHALMQHFLDHGHVAEEPDLGDLVFFGKSGCATHVGLCLGDGKMMEAAGGDSSTTTIMLALARGARVRVSEMSRRKDMLCVLRPGGLDWSS